MQHRSRRTMLASAGVAAVLAVSGWGGETAAASGVRTVPAQDAVSVFAEGDAVLLDVRTPEEYSAGHVAGARNLALAGNFESEVARLPRDGRYVLYCRTGNRSAQAAEIMERLGFTDVLDAGGLPALAAAGAEVVTG